MRHQEHKWCGSVLIHRPSQQALRELGHYAGIWGEPLINRLDLALDHVTNSRVDAVTVQRYIVERKIKAYHSKQEEFAYSDTWYSSKKQEYEGNNCLIFS